MGLLSTGPTPSSLSLYRWGCGVDREPFQGGSLPSFQSKYCDSIAVEGFHGQLREALSNLNASQSPPNQILFLVFLGDILHIIKWVSNFSLTCRLIFSKLLATACPFPEGPWKPSSFQIFGVKYVRMAAAVQQNWSQNPEEVLLPPSDQAIPSHNICSDQH